MAIISHHLWISMDQNDCIISPLKCMLDLEHYTITLPTLTLTSTPPFPHSHYDGNLLEEAADRGRFISISAWYSSQICWTVQRCQQPACPPNEAPFWWSGHHPFGPTCWGPIPEQPRHKSSPFFSHTPTPHVFKVRPGMQTVRLHELEVTLRGGWQGEGPPRDQGTDWDALVLSIEQVRGCKHALAASPPCTIERAAKAIVFFASFIV